MATPWFVRPDAYSVADYGRMIGDEIRMGCYTAALRELVTPSSTVLDIGTGSGVFALLAARLGARRVVAVEPTDVIELARELAEANGVADRIEFVQDVSTRVRLEEGADVILFDIHGALPLHRRYIPTVIDARERLLAPGGSLVPFREELWGAIVEHADDYRKHVEAWRSFADLDMETARQQTVNGWWSIYLRRDALLSGGERWATLDYRTIETADVEGPLAWTVSRAGTAHGFCLWFRSSLTDDVSFETAPEEPETIYRHGFFPFAEAVAVQPGDEVRIDLAARLVGSDYVFTWRTRIARAGAAGADVEFAQSTLQGTHLTPAMLRRSKESYRPELNELGRIERLILTRMGEGSSVGEIANEVAQTFPGAFTTSREALDHVASLSGKYSL